jgi:hypothetical protein
VFELALAQADAVLGEFVLQPGLAFPGLFGQRRPALPLVEKRPFIGAGRVANGAHQVGVALCLALARLAILIEPANLGGQPFEAVAAVVGDVLFEFGFLRALCVALPVAAPDLRVLAAPVFGETGKALVEQAELEAGEIGRERLAAIAQFLDLYRQRGMLVAVGDQRREQCHLPLGLEYRFVGAVEVVEVTDQRGNAWLDIEGLEHVAAHEVGQVADRFHRHRLVEEIERLLVVDAEATAEPGAVGREAVEDLAPRPPQPLAQAGDVGAEVGKVTGDREIAFGGDEEARRLPLRVLDPEHLRQRHRLVVTGVVKDAEDHRVVVVVAQRHRPRRAADLVALRLVVAEDVRAQRPFAAVGPGGLVVGDALRRHQQRRHRIDQRRFARADVTGQEGIPALRIERPHTPVESAPVEHFEPLQAEAREGVVGNEIEAEGLRLIHRMPPPARRAARGSRPAAGRTRPATAHRRTP